MIVTSEIDTKVFNPHSSWAAANAAQKDGVPITDKFYEMQDGQMHILSKSFTL